MPLTQKQSWFSSNGAGSGDKGQKQTDIGIPAYGSTGTPCMIPLRCCGGAQVVSVGYRLLDGTEFIGKGIMPDIEKDAASI